MRILITTLLWGAFAMGYAQECSMLMPDNVKVMGLSQRSVAVDLDEVETVTLPIVFHIVHTGSTSEANVSDEQILSQLDVLNEEFEDSKIQFCLAVRDPDGNPTNGITRTDMSYNNDYLVDGISNGQGVGADQFQVKYDSGCWNPDEYLNYYVVSEINGNDGGNGVQGFAYLGPTNDCRDGVVCLYNVTGTVGILKPGRTLGFTGVHEVGHYLSLYHTFSNSNDCIETNCETQGDQVCDTPPTQTNTGCDNPVCPDALTENFMDYTVESCKESFTVGQAERMHEQLQTVRSGLVDNLSCVPVVDYDVTPLTALYQETWCTPYQDIWIDVVNQGTLPIEMVEVQLYCSGNEYIEYIYDVQPGVQSVLFQHVLVDGASQFEVQTISDQDQYADNDYAWWPISSENGELMQIFVDTDTWANETNWAIYDSSGEEIIGDGGYPIQSGPYAYEVCVYNGCYDVVITDSNGDGFCSIDFGNDGTCDIGSEGITATVNGDTVFATGFGAEFSVWEETFCVDIDPCPLDFDGNGTVGNGDIIYMVGEWGCQGDCETDPNNDGIVDVFDLLYILAEIGDECPVEQDLSIGMLKDLTVISSDGVFGGGPPQIFDMTGRQVRGPVDELATGVYILKWGRATKKVFVQ
jgi:hypothetical protein